MDAEHKIVRDILLWLWQRHDDWLKNEASGPQHDLHQQLAEKHTPFGQLDLEGLLNKEQFKSGDKFIFLIPPEEAALVLPVLHLNWNFARAIPEIRLRLCLFCGNKEGLVDVGFRFESPERAGNHNYYHAQPIVPFGAKGIPQPSTTFPTFTLDARNPVTLLTCMLISLYGQEYLKQLSLATFKDSVQPHISEMHWADFTRSRHFPEDEGHYGVDQNDKRWRWTP